VRFAAGLILAVAGVPVTLYGALTMGHAGDVEGDEPAVWPGIGIALGGVAAIAVGIWMLRSSRRS
jgi:hypothetical protein